MTSLGRTLRVFGSVAATLAVLTSWSIASQAQQTAQEPQDVFRSGVDLIQLDVTVLDADGRPIRGLTADDFTILEDGTPQSIVTFVPVDVPPASRPHATWMTEILEDIVSNAQDTRRFVVIVMDDASTGYVHGESRSARAIGRAVIEALGPEDMAAVIFTFSGRPQTFTTDRARLLEAVDSFRPRRSPDGDPLLACGLRMGCVVDTLTNIAATLRTAAPARKLVIFIGSRSGLNLDLDPFTRMTPVLEMFRAMQEANVTVNVFDPAGLRTYGPTAADRSLAEAQARMAASRRAVDELRALAENTGGRTFVDTNAPEAHVPAVFEQSGSYYLLGFQSTNENHDGRFRRLRVQVHQPDVTARTRSGYFAPRRSDTRRPPAPPQSAEAALRDGLPARALPVDMHVALFAVPGEREAAVTVTAALRLDEVPDPAAAPPFRVVTAAFDADLRPRGRFDQTVRLPSSEDEAPAAYDVHARLPLRPGRYELRLAVEHGGRTGSVFANVDVPDFTKLDVAVSDLVLGRGSRPAAGSAIAGLLPVAPTAVRDFETDDRVTAFLRIHQPGRRPPASIAVTTRLVDARDAAVFERTDRYDAERFAATRTADHQIELPLRGLPAGPYLLVVEAADGRNSLRRTARFSVR
jgi:VWFA-related protein